jgi:hypothetical protein
MPNDGVEETSLINPAVNRMEYQVFSSANCTLLLIATVSFLVGYFTPRQSAGGTKQSINEAALALVTDGEDEYHIACDIIGV